ncbi:DUF4296 domain-containing protein [Hymenobacter terrenus]|uniref:DUF4296 domain-containing protein n=1 Tax=Hymenobacter terrenus TaxID=1629124 RepID=UPI00069884A1|nr:DUF4296 domain-containing protein [Hymenobacter terrenus]
MKSFRRYCLGLALAPLLLAVPACQRPEEPPQPADLVPKEKMISLLADLHLLEARVESSRLSPDSARALYLTQQKNLLWKQEITDSAFQRSYRYYGIHGKDLNDIYGAVIDTLGQREAKLNPKKPAPKPGGKVK